MSLDNFSKLDFSDTCEISLHQEEYLGLNIELLAFIWGDIVIQIATKNTLLKYHDYHARDWERIGTDGILTYWKSQIDSGEIWE